MSNKHEKEQQGFAEETLDVSRDSNIKHPEKKSVDQMIIREQFEHFLAQRDAKKNASRYR